MTRTPLSRSKGQRSTCRGRGILWRPPAQLVFVGLGLKNLVLFTSRGRYFSPLLLVPSRLERETCRTCRDASRRSPYTYTIHALVDENYTHAWVCSALTYSVLQCPGVMPGFTGDWDWDWLYIQSQSPWTTSVRKQPTLRAAENTTQIRRALFHLCWSGSLEQPSVISSRMFKMLNPTHSLTHSLLTHSLTHHLLVICHWSEINLFITGESFSEGRHAWAML